MVRSAAPLPPTPSTCGIGQADALELVARPDEQDALDVVGRLGLDHDALRAVGRAGVGVDQHRTQVGEVLDQAGLRGAHDVADRGRVLELTGCRP